MTYNLGNYIDAMQKEYQGEDKAQLLDLLEYLVDYSEASAAYKAQ